VIRIALIMFTTNRRWRKGGPCDATTTPLTVITWPPPVVEVEMLGRGVADVGERHELRKGIPSSRVMHPRVRVVDRVERRGRRVEEACVGSADTSGEPTERP
jgi:hypothetical protein